MEITETFHAKNRDEWRKWLKKNHDQKNEIWLVRYKKHTGKLTVSYDDSVEEAICFGWIDSTVKRIDDEKYVQRLTPRRKGSIWSLTNIDRARKMIEGTQMTEHGLKKIPDDVMEAIKSGKIKHTKTVIPKVLPTPPKLKKALAKNEKARNNWEKFAPSHRKMYIYWIMDAKREETRDRRIKKVVEQAIRNKKTMM
jgi:uncharacterized protein YdeI (YjbR/CyaY-like superfamily)